jgi:hypothetical protein
MEFFCPEIRRDTADTLFASPQIGKECTDSSHASLGVKKGSGLRSKLPDAAYSITAV